MGRSRPSGCDGDWRTACPHKLKRPQGNQTVTTDHQHKCDAVQAVAWQSWLLTRRLEALAQHKTLLDT